MTSREDFLFPEAADVDPQRGVEMFLLLLIGGGTGRISMLHLEKEAFILWNFHPGVHDFIQFVAHLRGPFSKEIADTIRSPVYCEDCWLYTPPMRGDRMSGGQVELTSAGHKQYNNLFELMQKQQQPSLNALLTGIRMVRRLYDQLTDEELLLLIYDTYPNFATKSTVIANIEKRRIELAEQMARRGVIDRERLESLINRG